MKNFFTLSRAAAVAHQFPGLLVEAERIARSYMKGAHGRRRVGTGETFWQFRHYHPGDASRDVDWKQSARHDNTLFVRQREWEASQTIALYRDSSTSMQYSSDKKYPSKQMYADVLLLALACVLLEGGEQVTLLGTNLAAQSNTSSLPKIHDMLDQQTHLTESVRPLPSHAHAVIISDFCYPFDEAKTALEPLIQRNIKGTLVHVFDPAEETLPFSGRINFFDPEQPSQTPLPIDQVEAIRDIYTQKFHQHQQSIQSTANSWGWNFVAFSTSMPLEQALGKIYDLMTVK